MTPSLMRGVEKQGSTTVTETTRNSSKVGQEDLRRLFAAVQPK